MSPSDFPDWVIWRFEELVEEGELEVERRREELRDWAYWIYIEGSNEPRSIPPGRIEVIL